MEKCVQRRALPFIHGFWWKPVGDGIDAYGGGWRSGVKNERENCSICSFVTFALCRTDKRNYTVRPEWYIPLHFHTRHTVFPSSLHHTVIPIRSFSLRPSIYSSTTLAHFPHRMHRQPIFVYNSIVFGILLCVSPFLLTLSPSVKLIPQKKKKKHLFFFNTIRCNYKI